MTDDTLNRLRSSDPDVRMLAWSRIVEELNARCRRLTRKEARDLNNALREEDDANVFRFALAALFGYLLSALATDNPFAELTLDEWFSHHFQRRSALFSTKEPDYRARDPLALANLARRFPEWIYPDTDLQPLPLDDDQLGKLLGSRKYETILIVGRPWMFGHFAVEVQNTAGAKLKFRFPCGKRPENLEPGAISSEYHCIEERLADGQHKMYRTKNEGNKRTDYGLVQVYPKYRDQLTLVMCGGCSSLGTLGAARWLSYYLRNQAIPATPGVSADTTMEALVKITAESDPYGWDDPSSIELVKLYADKYVFNFDTKEWDFAKRPVLTLERESGSPVSVYFDDEELRFQYGSDAFRLIANMVLEAAKSADQTVKVETLARNQDIWTNSGGVDPVYAKKRLQSLNSTKLHRVLSFPHDKVQLNADVEIKDA